MREAGPLVARTEAVAASFDFLVAARACARTTPLFYWEHPARGDAMLGVGIVREIRASGPDRFPRTSEAALRILTSIAGDAAARATLRVVGGYGFADRAAAGAWPAARLVLPRRLFLRVGGRTTVTDVWDEGDPEPAPFDDQYVPSIDLAAETLRLHAGPVAPDARAEWTARVERVRALLATGAVEKVVLARQRRLVADAPIDPATLVARARVARPTCFNVWVRDPRGTSFVASTPELLVRRHGAAATASALAGSAPRGRDRVADARAAADLLACPKNAREHAIVVAAVRAALATVADDVSASPAPALLSLPEVHHLATVVAGRLRTAASVIDVAGVLHPTPAVCGAPRIPARALIEREEPDRGWYTGALGWMDAAGDGELAVALRSALVDGPNLTLWAGAGIVEGSDAEAELAETEAKMRALVVPFLVPGLPAAAREPARAADAAMAGGAS